MYRQRIKMLREEQEIKQEDISNILNCNRSTYANWESDVIVVPLLIADKLSIIYNVSLSYLLGLNDQKIITYKQNNINYDFLLKLLNNLKKKNNHTYNVIGEHIVVNRSTCYRYFKGLVSIPTDKLILLCDLYRIDIDEITGKKI